MDLNSLVERSITDTLASLLPFAPELILCVSIMGLLLVRLLPFGKLVDAGYLSIVGVIAALYYGGPWTLAEDSVARELFGGMIVYDSFTVYIRSLLLIFTVLFILLTKFSGMPDKEDGTDFYCLILGAILGMCLMVSANHLLMVFLAVEMASVPSYVLAGIMRGKRPASEAALKYSIYGAGTAGVMLYGISLLVGMVNTAHLPSIAVQLAANFGGMSGSEQLVLVLASLMIMVGLAFKLSAVPFHFWCPDIFEGATAEIAAFLSIASKAAALALLVRVCLGVGVAGPQRTTADGVEPAMAVASTMTDAGSVGMFAVEDQVGHDAHSDNAHGDEAAHGGEAGHGDEVGHAAVAPISTGGPLAPIRGYLGLLISIMAAVTCTFGNLAAYAQTNIKRLLAYSTIAHAGYMMLPVPAALAVAQIAPDSARDAISAIVFYIGVYMFMNLGAFAIIAFLRNSTGTEEIADYGGLLKRSPVLVVCLAMILFSLVGLPPFAGFIGKFAIFASLADTYKLTGQTHLMVLLVIAGINTAISLFYYLRVVKVMCIDPESDAVASHTGNFASYPQMVFTILVTVPVALLIINWNLLGSWSAAAAQQLFG